MTAFVNMVLLKNNWRWEHLALYNKIMILAENVKLLTNIDLKNQL